jgi:Spy/CpxP family protein refolding chaperone
MVLFLMALMMALIPVAEVRGQDIPPGKWWRDPQMIRSLELTPSQISQLDQAYANSRQQLFRKKSRVESEQMQLQNLFDQQALDENAVKTQHFNVERAREDLSSERLEYIMEIRKIIGHEKYNRLTHGDKKGKKRPSRD